MRLRGEGHVGTSPREKACCSTCGVYNPACARCRGYAQREALAQLATFSAASPYRSPPAPTLEQRLAVLEFEKETAYARDVALEQRIGELHAELRRSASRGLVLPRSVFVSLLILLCLNLGMLTRLLGR